MYGNNDYRNYLMHHGIEGQKWGVKNGPPYPLEGKGKSRFNERKRKRELKEKDKLVRKQRKQAVKNRRTLSDEEIEKLASRIRSENTLKQLVENDQERGKTTVNNILSNSGKKVLGVAVTGTMLYGLNILIKSGIATEKNKGEAVKKLKSSIDLREAAAYIAPRPKNK